MEKLKVPMQYLVACGELKRTTAVTELIDRLMYYVIAATIVLRLGRACHQHDR
jgi:hypothetical protein